jgi:hypothetical protein
MVNNNATLTKVGVNKEDEFYTQIAYIEKELAHYPPETFQGKSVFCNCDDPEYSNFWLYFKLSFKHLGLITFLDRYNPDQFEILGMDDHRVAWRGRGPDLNGKPIYRRIIIRNKHPLEKTK